MGLSLSSLPMTAAIAYDVVSALGVNIDLMSFCSLIPAIMGTIAVFFIYFLGKDMGGKAVGMLAALFLALGPSVIQRTSLGFFDTETVGIVSLVLFSFLFLRAIEENRSVKSSILYSVLSAGVLAYFVTGWGAAYYLIGLTTLFVFVLILLRRYSPRLFLSYSLTFGLGLLISINNPFLGTTYLTSYAVLPVFGVFVLLCLSEVIRNLASTRAKLGLVIGVLAALIGGFTAIAALGYMENIAGKFASVIDPFTRDSNAIIASVAEHKISAWGSLYYDLGIAILFFVVGLFFVARNLTARNVFLLLFGATSLYFASSMVRLLVIFTPAFAIIAGIGIVSLLKPFVTLLREPPRISAKRKFGLEHVGKEFSGTAVFLVFILLVTNLAFAPQSGGVPKVYRQAYSPITITGGSLAIIPNQPVTEWYDMLTYLSNFQNAGTVVVSWWDYGYWLTLLGNVTTLSDNATINSTQIENVGFVFMSNETNALRMLKQYNAEYILVYVTFDTGGNFQDSLGGDNGKWSWMARISGENISRFVDAGFLGQNSTWTDQTPFGNVSSSTGRWEWNDLGRNTTVYKLMSWAKDSWCNDNSVTDPDAGNVTQPVYFQKEYFAQPSRTDALSKYAVSSSAGIVPQVALYKIDWQKYYADYPSG